MDRQLSFDDVTADPAPSGVMLGDIARDIYRQVARDMGITRKDQRLLLALQVRAGEALQERTPDAVAADFLLMEILYGCDFLADPDAAADPYDDKSWLFALARIGALALVREVAGDALDD